MTKERLEKYLRSLECQKRDPNLLRADGPYCLRKLQEHLEEVQDLLRIIKEDDMSDTMKSELMDEEKSVREAVEFYMANATNGSQRIR